MKNSVSISSALVVIIGLSIMITACNTRNSPKVQYDSTKDLLGAYNQNLKLGIGYNVPAGFVKLTDEKLIKRCQAILPIDEDRLSGNVIYQDYESGSFMVVSEMGNNTWKKFEQFAIQASASPLSLKWNHINTTTFRRNDLDIQQWILRNHEWVNYKLLFQKDQVVFQADYFIPFNVYGNGFAKFIESSIETFNSAKKH